MKRSSNMWKAYLRDSKRAKNGGPVIRREDTIPVSEREVADLVYDMGGQLMAIGKYYIIWFDDSLVRLLLGDGKELDMICKKRVR